MSVSKVSPATPVDLPTGAIRPTDSTSDSSRQSSQRGRPGEHVPLRFPWLSWETRQLEAASKQPSPYGRVPLLGETLDHKV